MTAARVCRPLCLLLVLLFGSGCSVQMAYNNLDRLARWSVNDYVDMDNDQRAYFDAAVEQLWYWHRREHLPQYAELLDTLGVRLADGTDAQQMQALAARVMAWAGEIEERAMPIAVELLASLSDEQVAHLGQALEESNLEMVEPELDAAPAEIRRHWREVFEDRFTDFSGQLTTVQTAYLNARAADYVPERMLWADYRRRWQRDFLALLRYRHDVAGLGRGLRQLSAHRELYYGPELRAADAGNEAIIRNATIWLINSLTERQRQRFVNELSELAEDFRELSRQDRPPPAAEAPCLVMC